MPASSPHSASNPPEDKKPRPLSEATTIDFSRPDSLVGRTLDGRFAIEKNLTDNGADAGGIGVVYLARDLKLMGKEVVVKILNETALQHPDIIRKFEHEKEALIRMDHPGILRILDSGNLVGGNPFMVMEYIKGHSLRKAIRLAGKLPLEMAANIIESLTDALSAAHSEGILHRDIKPENIMLTPLEEGLYHVRLIDFGIARVENSKLAPATEISRAIGSILYIAPEQLIGKLDLGPAADIYATGIVIYEMLTGEVPFKPKAVAEMFQLQKEGVKVRPSALRHDLPRVAEQILMTALEFDSEKRPQNARAFGRYIAKELRVDGFERDRYFTSVQTEFYKPPGKVDAGTPDTAETPTIERIQPGSKPSSNKFIWVIATLAFVLLAGAAGLGLMLLSPGTPAASNISLPANVVPADLGDKREFSYFLLVQKMRNGSKFETPFRSSGQEIFETGYKFTLNVRSEDPGYIYIINEGKDKQGSTQFNVLFPSPNVNNGSARVQGGQEVQTAQNTFGGGRGTEIMWIFWTLTKQDELDKALTRELGPAGQVAEQSQPRLQSFIEEHRSASRDVISEKDSTTQRTIVRGVGETVVHRFELEHR